MEYLKERTGHRTVRIHVFRFFSVLKIRRRLKLFLTMPSTSQLLSYDHLSNDP